MSTQQRTVVTLELKAMAPACCSISKLNEGTVLLVAQLKRNLVVLKLVLSILIFSINYRFLIEIITTTR